jgi:hypothetical protein
MATQQSALFFDEPGEMASTDPNVPTIAVGGAPYLGGGLDMSTQALLDPTYGAMANTSYPPAMIPGSRSRASSNAGSEVNAYGISRQGTTYPPANTPSGMFAFGDGPQQQQQQEQHHAQGQQQPQFFQNMSPFGG